MFDFQSLFQSCPIQWSEQFKNCLRKFKRCREFWRSCTLIFSECWKSVALEWFVFLHFWKLWRSQFGQNNSQKLSKNWKTAILGTSKYENQPSKNSKISLLRNQVNYSPGTDQHKIRLARLCCWGWSNQANPF